jgi:heme/copper-type cytochrome/quinol oxidase subunit 2
MDDWLIKHMHGVLVTVEILWVGGFLAVFVVYFVIKYRLKRNKSRNTDHDIKDP